LFLDEATSFLDTETEKQIKESFTSLKRQYIIVIIAHRLNTIKNVNEAVVLNQVKIDLFGSYNEVLKRSMAFRRLVKLQGV
jgi:ABC-type multidrug transport system fused ATPase/permease subunit